MYHAHFGLKEAPFGITPDPSFAFSATTHQEALNTLIVAVAGGEGFIKITGEVGTGKTLLCRRFLSMMDSNYATAYIPNPLMESRGLVIALALELGIHLPQSGDLHDLLRALNHRLLVFARSGKKVVVCIDEAQAMPPDTLEALRLVSNLETEKRKLIQVVIFGQPELEVKLSQPSARQLRQRITFEYRLCALGKDEVRHYVAHRLRVAGYQGEPVFSGYATRLLHRTAGGVPRLLNIVAHKALLTVYGEGGRRVKARHVRAAARDTPFTRRVFPWFWAMAPAAIVCVGVCMSAGIIFP